MRAHVVRLFPLLAVAAVALVSAAAQPQAQPAGAVEKRLILLGGAPRPRVMWQKFSTFAGDAQARALALPWASGDPEGTIAINRRELEGIRPESFLEMAPLAPLDAAAKKKLLEQLARANAILIMGGDQNRFLDVINDHPDVKAAIKARYEAGVVVAANDGGAISVGEIAVTGEEDPTIVDGDQVGVRPGLGLLPRAIIDTQFVRRQRYNRMLGVLIKNPDKVVLGIGSGTAFVLRNGCAGEVIGSNNSGTNIAVVMRTLNAVRPERPGRVDMLLFRPGNTFDCEGIFGESR